MKNIFYQGPGLTRLHEHYAKNGKIDVNAPVISASEISIRALPEKIWRYVYDIAKWAEFCPGFEKIIITGEIKPNAKFSFVLNKFPVKATFAIVDPNSELSWVGVSLWTKAVDRITIVPNDNDFSLLRIEESLAGIFIPLFVTGEQLENQHAAWLIAMKNKIENGA